VEDKLAFFSLQVLACCLQGNYAGRQAQARLTCLCCFFFFFLSSFFSFFWCSPGKAGGQGRRGDWGGGCEGSGGRSEQGY